MRVDLPSSTVPRGTMIRPWPYARPVCEVSTMTGAYGTRSVTGAGFPRCGAHCGKRASVRCTNASTAAKKRLMTNPATAPARTLVRSIEGGWSRSRGLTCAPRRREATVPEPRTLPRGPLQGQPVKGCGRARWLLRQKGRGVSSLGSAKRALSSGPRVCACASWRRVDGDLQRDARLFQRRRALFLQG